MATGGRTQPVVWRELQGEVRDEAWRAMLRTWPSHAEYEERTDRAIPVFLLTRLA